MLSVAELLYYFIITSCQMFGQEQKYIVDFVAYIKDEILSLILSSIKIITTYKRITKNYKVSNWIDRRLGSD